MKIYSYFQATEICNERGRNKEKVLIFVETKLYADTLGSLLGQKGITATTIHGDRIQRDRELAIRDFKVKKILLFHFTLCLFFSKENITFWWLRMLLPEVLIFPISKLSLILICQKKLVNTFIGKIFYFIFFSFEI